MAHDVGRDALSLPLMRSQLNASLPLMRRQLNATCLVALLALTLSVTARAQAARAFKGRIAPVPIDISMQATISGSGSITATLSGKTLSVAGTFSGLRSPATTAQVRKSPVRGVRGPVVFDLSVSHDTSGTISGTFELTPAQIGDLENGRVYVQLHSEKAPDGNLWGWLLPETKR
jgi:hypothetical protein